MSGSTVDRLQGDVLSITLPSTEDGGEMHRGIWSRLVGAMLALVVLALGGAGCGSGGNDDNRGSTTANGKRGGTLTLATPAFPTTLDAGMGSVAFSYYNDLVYDPLLVMEADGSFKPGLALSWGYGPRNMSFNMKLRPNVTFSDGAKLDAQAVKTWIHHVATVPGGNGSGYFANLR